MLDTKILVYLTGELAILLLVICILLLIHIGRLKQLIRKLEAKIVSLRQAVGLARKETKDVLKKLAAKEKFKPKSFLDYLDEAINDTREQHRALNPDRDIVLDITPDTPIDRQAMSLRHAFLIAEKEARHAGDDDRSSGEVLQTKFQQIIQFYQSLMPAPKTEAAPELESMDENISEEIENYKRRIENLERFKKLFFDMEKEWAAAKKQADDYHEQLLAMSKDLGAGEDFEQLLDQYSQSFNDIENIIALGIEGGADREKKPADADERESRQPGVGKMVIANQEEIQRLRNMAVDQHKVITQLKKKLYEAQSAEDKEQLVEALTQQIEKQERFLNEAETCTRLLENELSRLMRENEALDQQVKALPANQNVNAEEVEQLQNLIGELTTESKEMLSTIADLERQNLELQNRTGSTDAGGPADSEQVSELQEKLGAVQQELLNLQTQHIELEERYLELKMK